MGGPYTLRVAFFDPSRGFGIATNGGDEVFVHVSQKTDPEPNLPKSGDTLKAESLESDERGIKAVGVTGGKLSLVEALNGYKAELLAYDKLQTTRTKKRFNRGQAVPAPGGKVVKIAKQGFAILVDSSGRLTLLDLKYIPNAKPNDPVVYKQLPRGDKEVWRAVADWEPVAAEAGAVLPGGVLEKLKAELRAEFQAEFAAMKGDVVAVKQKNDDLDKRTTTLENSLDEKVKASCKAACREVLREVNKAREERDSPLALRRRNGRLFDSPHAEELERLDHDGFGNGLDSAIAPGAPSEDASAERSRSHITDNGRRSKESDSDRGRSRGSKRPRKEKRSDRKKGRRSRS